MWRILAPEPGWRHGSRTNGWNSQPDAGRPPPALGLKAPTPDIGLRAGWADANHEKWTAAPPSPLPVDDGPAQADLAVIEDDGLTGGDGPLRLCKAHLDA